MKNHSKTWRAKAALALTVAAGSLLLLLAGAVQAGVVVTTVGDPDGFGIGAAHGDLLDVFFVGPADGDGTDELIDGGTTITVNHGLTGKVLAAQLEIFSGGWGAYGPASLSINGSFIGLLTDGETGLDSFAYQDIFSLNAAQQALLTGNDSVTITPAAGTEIDQGVIDYLRLSVSTDARNDVPEPAGHGLVGMALLAAGVAGRRARRPVSVKQAGGV